MFHGGSAVQRMPLFCLLFCLLHGACVPGTKQRILRNSQQVVVCSLSTRRFPSSFLLLIVNKPTRNDVYRTVDGSCNLLEMPMMGAMGTEFIQLFPPSQSHPDPVPDVADVAAMIKRPSVIDESRLAPFSQIGVAWVSSNISFRIHPVAPLLFMRAVNIFNSL
jgi:hypothetical protein